MEKLTPLLISIALWSSIASANLPPASAREASTGSPATVSAYTRHLNHYYSDLNVSVAPMAEVNSTEVLGQLKSLEDYLHGETSLSNGSLTKLACGRCVCNGCE